jgi:putative ABC transport system ATP-binding protein
MHGAHRHAVLRIERVSKAYDTGAGRTVVLESAAFSLRAAEKASLVGPSGSGKSTLLALVAGLIRPDSGQIEIGGVPVHGLDDAGRAALRAEQVGVVLQSDNLIPFLSAQENVELAMEFTGRRARRERARQLLAELGVDHRRDHLPRQLSGGEAQRVALAVALANEPSLVLADEVVGQLDTATAERVLEVLFGSDRTVLFVTHDEQLAARAERRLRLVDRAVVEE